ncbi:hypothetical protein LWI28_009081 [Acer negundo]|uniref:AB hydrolase-1 domain-containing protein n=1 Tax=Acer negundo TaxID=4023 RepID=A0AAD5IZJ9_ACENE|nr:hypothetical protein LWI28_009081 [Acer negundo]
MVLVAPPALLPLILRLPCNSPQPSQVRTVPPLATSYTVFHIVGDLVGLVDKLGIEHVFLVGHDWGAIIARYFCMFRPNRVKALVNTSVTFYPKNPARKPMDGFRALFGDDYYICRPNRVKALVNTSVAFYPINPTRKPMDSFRPCSMMIIISAGTWIAQIDTAKLVKRFLSSRSPKPPCIPKETGYRDLPDPPALPSWLSEEDVNYYAAKFSQKGFTGGLNYYRYLNLTWELAAPWTAVQIKVPVKFIVGDLDLGYNIPGTKEYIHNGGFKKDVPLLQEVVMEGVSHFLNQEKPERQS